MSEIKKIVVYGEDGQREYGIEDSVARQDVLEIVAGAPEELDSFREAFEAFKEGNEALTGIEAKALDASSAEYETTENAVVLKFATIEGVGDEITIPAATTEQAGVMSAEDKKKIIKSITWNNDTNPSNMNDFVVAGVYDIKGERTRTNDNLPILNTGGGHTFNARLTVLDSSIERTEGEPQSNDKCITQILSFDNRLGQGEVYIRTGKGSSLNNLTWENWSTLQRNMNVGDVHSLDDLKDNGIYSGVWLKGSYYTYPLTFVCVVINDYFIGITPRRISQFVYGLSKFDGSVVYQSRVWDDSKNKWSDWEILNQKKISSMIDKAIDELSQNIEEDKEKLNKSIQNVDVSPNTDDVKLDLEDNTGEITHVVFPAATTESAGVMSVEDKKALDTATSRALRVLFVAAGAEYNNSGADKTKTAPWGETVTHKAGCYYLNGLGDITEQQMIGIYNAPHDGRTAFSYARNRARTFILRGGTQQTGISSLVAWFAQAYNMEALGLVDFLGVASGSCERMFSGCVKLKHLHLGDLLFTHATGFIDAFTGCSSLITCNIKKIAKNISFKDSSKISKESIIFIIGNSVPTSAITITLHHDAYVRLTADQEVLDALTAKNEALTAESKGGKISLVCATHSEEITPNA